MHTTNGVKPPPADRRLAQPHEALLRASAVDPTVITQRDYWTAITAKEIAGLGFQGTQQHAPALVLPVWDV